MKQLFLVICIASACAPKTAQETSASVNDTLVVTDTVVPPEDEIQLVSESESDATDSTLTIFQNCMQEVADEIEVKSVYRLSFSFSGYENSSDATFYFDSLFNLRYCETTWSMEGTSGSYTNYFRDDLLAAAKELNSYNVYDEEVIICPHDRGFGYQSKAGEYESGIAMVNEEDFRSKQAEAINEYNRLKDRIREYASESSKEQGITRILIENTVNYGADFTETETYEIDDPLFEALFE